MPNLTRLGLETVLCDLASIGYDAEWQIISAADVGAPHLRRRIWIVAYPSGIGGSTGFADQATGKERYSAELVDRGKNMAYTESGNVTRVLSVPGGESRTGSGRETDRGYSGDRIGDWWSTEPNVGRVADGIPKRVDRLKGLGNAIVPQIAEIIGRLICE